jgi:hypothetical protein
VTVSKIFNQNTQKSRHFPVKITSKENWQDVQFYVTSQEIMLIYVKICGKNSTEAMLKLEFMEIITFRASTRQELKYVFM